MKKTLLVVVIILAVILALPAFNLIQWFFQSKKTMDIILLDKTVPSVERENHKAFSWIMTHDRYVDSTRKSYNYKKDYYGWFPLRPLRDHEYKIVDYRLTDVIEYAKKHEALYIADTYGVFFNDWYRGINKSRRTRKLFGGLNNTDNLLIKEMKDRNKLVILEYNSFDYPTAAFDSYRTQERMGVEFTGWTGKHFNSLDTASKDFPVWLPGYYRKEHKKPWTFTKSGIVLINQKNNVIVLEEGTHLSGTYPIIVSDTASCEKYGFSSKVAFDEWFDIIVPVSSRVISSYHLQTTPEGDSLLMDHNLTGVFPAVVQESNSPNVYYFAGNFAYSDKPEWTALFKNIEILNRFFYSEKADDPRRFFWLYYKPLVSTIFGDYYKSMKGQVTAVDK
ncbi:MAG TPA: hypothetical protein VHO46_09110 [Bacteroidales bacterium]|nr:hypothetical protein [Bacteroidales bacterium]